jgi:small conductance mechanosensitive channel
MTAALLLAALRTAHPVLPATEELLEMAARIGLTLVGGFIVLQLLFLLVRRMESWIKRLGHNSEQSKRRAATVGSIVRNLIIGVIAGGVIIHCLEVVGWDVKPLLAGAGVAGVALGFGAQTLVRDIIAGIFIIAQDQFGVGDLIEANGRIGTVEELSPRSTTLRDFNGYLVFVPNGEMRVVVNRSRGWNRVAVDVPVASGDNLDRALEQCRAVATAMNADAQWRERLLDPIDVWGVESLGPSEAQIRLVVRASPGGDAPEVARELRRRLHAALATAGVRTTLPREAPAPVPSRSPEPVALRPND